MKTVLIIGHSFVRRMIQHNMDFSLDTTRASITLCGHIANRPLVTIEQLWNDFQWVLNNYGVPDVAVIFLGSNDLCNRLRPVDYSCQIVAVAQEFKSMGTKQVLFPEVLPRYGLNAFNACPQFLTTFDIVSEKDAEKIYYHRVLKFNRYVKLSCAVPGFRFVRMRGLHRGLRAYLDDGIHLSAKGRKKMRASLRREIIVALLRCSGNQ